jgi:hypothetical protein
MATSDGSRRTARFKPRSCRSGCWDSKKTALDRLDGSRKVNQARAVASAFRRRGFSCLLRDDVCTVCRATRVSGLVFGRILAHRRHVVFDQLLPRS